MDGDSLKKSRMLAGIYQELARAYGTAFLDAGAFVRHYQADGCHFDRKGHRELAQGVFDTLRGMQYQKDLPKGTENSIKRQAGLK